MGEYKYIFHVHTEYSPDCDVKLNKLYKVLKKNKIFGVAITDHNTIKGAVKFKEKYGQDMHVIIGEEIMTTHGEIIGLFLKEEIKKGLSPIETIKQIKKQNGIVYIPHPYDKKRYKTCLKKEYILKFCNDIDIIENFNGRCIEYSDIQNAEVLSNKINKEAITGCDAHSCYELKFNHMIFTKEIDKDDIVSELKTARSSNKKSNKLVHHYTKFIRLKKILKEGKFHEALDIIYRKCKRRLHKISK